MMTPTKKRPTNSNEFDDVKLLGPSSPLSKRTMPKHFNSPKRSDSIRYKKSSTNEKRLKQLQRTPEQLPINKKRQQERYSKVHPKNKTHQRNVELEIEKDLRRSIIPTTTTTTTTPNVKQINHINKSPTRTIIKDSPVKKKVLDMYSKVRKRFGTLGGGGSGGPIYGEITTRSFQRIIKFMQMNCELNENSSFIDIGSGLGKPNFHVSLDVNVKLSVGVELGGERWWQSMILLKDFVPEYKLNNVFFAHGNVFDMKTLNPFSHVYMFDKGFPPNLMQNLSTKFNTSNVSKYLICYKKPKDIIDKYEFNVTHLGLLSTNMSGSGEGNSVHFYVKKESSSSSKSKSKSKKNSKEEHNHINMLRKQDFGFIVPPVPSDTIDSAPVEYARSYGQPGLTLLYEKELDKYTDWCIEQVGINDSKRSKRRLRRRK